LVVIRYLSNQLFINQITNMTTKDVADRLVSLCRQGNIMDAQKELYSAEIESIEPAHAPVKSARGIEAVTKKGMALRI
jgi:SnoaL-like domain